MGSMLLRCTCGTKLSVSAELAGNRAKCKSCGRPFVIPHSRKPASESTTRTDGQDSSGKVTESKRDNATTTQKPKATGQDNCPSCKRDMGRGTIVCIYCGYHTKLKKRLKGFNAEEIAESNGLIYAVSIGGSLILVAVTALAQRGLDGPQFLALYFVLYCIYGLLTLLFRMQWRDTDIFNYGAMIALLGTCTVRMVDGLILGKTKFGFLIFSMILTAFLYSMSLTERGGEKDPPLADINGKMSGRWFFAIFAGFAGFMALLFFIPEISKSLGPKSPTINVLTGGVLLVVWASSHVHVQSGGHGGSSGGSSSGFLHGIGSTSCGGSSCGSSCGSGCGGGCGGGGCGGCGD